MADIDITVNNQTWTITDDGDGTYSIDLSMAQARQPLRAERDELKAQRQEALERRDRAVLDRDIAIGQRDEAIARRDAAVAEAAAILVRIDEIRAFLTAAGDDPDA